MRAIGIMLLLALVQAAIAQSPRTRTPTSTFDALDSDHSDFLSHGEALAAPDVLAKFVVADKNKDGMLSRAEFDAAFARTGISPVKPAQPRAPQP